MNMKMNLNTLINKIHYIAFSVIVLFLSPAIAQQNLISWEVADPALNRKFIEMYLNKLIENDKLIKTRFKHRMSLWCKCNSKTES